MTDIAIKNRSLEKSDSRVGLVCPKSDTESRAERLREAVREAGGNRVVAQKSGVPTSTLGTYLGGGSGMKIEPLIALSEATGYALEWLATGQGPVHRGQEILPPPRPALGSVPEGYTVIPRYEVRAGAGRGVINPSDRIVEQMVVSDEYIRRRLRRRPEDMTLLEALGDSMSPTIMDGDVMMVDVSVTELRASAIYIMLREEEELVVKRLHKLNGGRILIIPDNERYPREEVTPSERDPIRIVGQVVWYGRPMPG